MAQKKKMVCLKDRLLGEGWFETEQEACAWAMMRRILVNDRLITSIGERVEEDGVIRVKEYYKRRYVNKGGLKLEKAMEAFGLRPAGAAALDCGASKGGFTDCLLQHGAQPVYAVDAGHGQLAGKLLIDPRVENLENTNLSDEKLLHLHPAPHFVTLDLSYLSLKKAVPLALRIMKNEGTLVCLVKPIFEVEDNEIRRTGKINEPAIHQEILRGLLAFFQSLGLEIAGLIHSPIRGNRDAIEYLLCLTTHPAQGDGMDLEDKMRCAVENAFQLEKFRKNEA